jgi:hypothetical protein
MFSWVNRKSTLQRGEREDRPIERMDEQRPDGELGHFTTPQPTVGYHSVCGGFDPGETGE